MKRFRLSAVVAVAAAILASTIGVYAAGLWSTLPIVGGASYCASFVTGTGNLGGATGQGQGTIGQICAQTVPAGPATFTGNEMVPMDLLAPGTSSTGPTTSGLANILQLGQGPIVDNNQAGAAVTIPNGTSWFVLDTNTPTTVTVTMPAAAVEGQEVHLLCGIAISTALTTSANTGQTMKGTAPSTCTAGQGFAWRYVGSTVPVNLSGAAGAIVANSWVRIY